MKKEPGTQWDSEGSQATSQYRRQLHRHMRNVHFKTSAGDEVYFDAQGDPPAHFDILNWIYYSAENMTSVKVGSLSVSATGEQQFTIDDTAIHWHPRFMQTPRSVCSESCLPGDRKLTRKEKPICCYDCTPCPEGEITNTTDMSECIACPAEQWSNEKRDACIPRTLELLSYDDPMGAILTSVTGVFFFLTAGVLGIFITFRDTPIVKANNRDLSYTLLLALMLSFLSSLLFIGRPSMATCALQQPAFGVVFTIAVSSVLAKTITVIIAFNATKPGSKLRNWVGTRVSSCLVILCSLGEVVVCTVWLLFSAPFPDIDTKSEHGKMILHCNQGSAFFFYAVVGYMAILAFLSFVVAALARKLPDSFNEAQFITFSMLVFCSVWVSFIPAYLSTKGKYMVAVEVLAIQASSAGLLGCIFIPKCHVILLRPERNTKEYLMGK
ncbi:vomeronasal type-2 receptor 26-like [Ambystoma mexicanum]|uniref:vomeronasal type-2 receptor 26-like n=1 Tax=Ambystoma mexicanum TaxID=8296 RepID=UPI0037E7A471